MKKKSQDLAPPALDETAKQYSTVQLCHEEGQRVKL